MDDKRLKFEQFMFSEIGHDLHSQINSGNMSANRFAWEVWQACCSSNEDTVRMDYLSDEDNIYWVQIMTEPSGYDLFNSSMVCNLRKVIDKQLKG